MRAKKIVVSGFSFSGSSAIVDFLTDHEGVVEFPGGEARPFHSRSSFEGLARQIRRNGAFGPQDLARCLATLRGDASEAGAPDLVTETGALHREFFGKAHEEAIDQFARIVSAAPNSGGTLERAAAGFIATLTEVLVQRTGAHTVVFDQGVRPWRPRRVKFYGPVSLIICLRDVRDQIIERWRHGIREPGFEVSMASRVALMRKGLANPRSGPAHQVWFEAFIQDRAARAAVLDFVGLAGSELRPNRAFNPLASRANIGLYRGREGMLGLTGSIDGLTCPTIPASVVADSEIADQAEYAESPLGIAGAIPKTGALPPLDAETGD